MAVAAGRGWRCDTANNPIIRIADSISQAFVELAELFPTEKVTDPDVWEFTRVLNSDPPAVAKRLRELAAAKEPG